MRKVVTMRKIAVSMVALAMMLGLGMGNFEGREASAAGSPLVWVFNNNDTGDMDDATILPVMTNNAFGGSFISEYKDDYILEVTLNNYRGGGFYWACRGTCYSAPSKIVFRLIGENKITAEGKVGISVSSPVEFIGDGTLEIQALVPVANGGEEGCLYTKDETYCSDMANVLKMRMRQDWPEVAIEEAMSFTMTIAPAKGVVIETPAKPEVKPEEPEQPEQPEEKPADDESVKEPETKPDSATDNKVDNGLVWHIVSGTYIGLSLVAFAALGVHQVVKRNKAKKSTTVEIKPKAEANAELNEEKTDQR